jgi:PAS domain-containing protein
MQEELASLKETQAQTEQDVASDQRHEIITEKEKIADAQKTLKILDLQVGNEIELSKLQAQHRIQLRQILRFHKDKRIKRKNRWASVVNREIDHASQQGSMSSSVQGKSEVQSMAHSRVGSDHNLQSASRQGLTNTTADDAAEAKANIQQREWKTAEQQQNLCKMQQSLVDLKKKHEKALYSLKQTHETAFTDLKESFNNEITEMEFRHEVDKKRLTTEADADVQEQLDNQDKELIMEGHIRAAETKALIERKVLNSLLDTFVDGVISIDPRGYIKRFNRAAEKMFGYTTEELIDRNANIKTLMPKRFSENHDNCKFDPLNIRFA